MQGCSGAMVQGCSDTARGGIPYLEVVCCSLCFSLCFSLCCSLCCLLCCPSRCVCLASSIRGVGPVRMWGSNQAERDQAATILSYCTDVYFNRYKVGTRQQCAIACIIMCAGHGRPLMQCSGTLAALHTRCLHFHCQKQQLFTLVCQSNVGLCV